MRPRTQKQPQVKKELCRVLDYVKCVEKNVQLVCYWYRCLQSVTVGVRCRPDTLSPGPLSCWYKNSRIRVDVSNWNLGDQKCDIHDYIKIKPTKEISNDNFTKPNIFKLTCCQSIYPRKMSLPFFRRQLLFDILVFLLLNNSVSRTIQLNNAFNKNSNVLVWQWSR